MSLKIAVPNKGRLFEETLELLRATGIKAVRPDNRLVETVNEGRYQILFVRAQDIPGFVECAAVDVGITGIDLIEEQGAKVERLLDLNFGYCKLMVAAPASMNVTSADKIPKGSTVSTPFPNLARRYFKDRMKVVAVSGATEITPLIGVSDFIVDLVQTGSTLKQHNLVPLDVILESWSVLIGNRESSKKSEVKDLIHSIRSVIVASKKRYLMANVNARDLKRVSGLIPGLAAPTVMKLSRKGLYAIHAVIEEKNINDLLARLKEAGASGILVLPIERMVV